MNSDLIVITFDDADEAEKVLDAMQSMRKEPLLGLEQTTVVTKDQKGKIRLHQRRDLTTSGSIGGEGILNLLAGLIFGSSLGMVWGIDVDDVVQTLAEQGFDDTFMRAVDETMGNNTSAILFLVRRDSASDPQEVLNVLSLFKGRIHQTTLSPQAEAYLVKILETKN